MDVYATPDAFVIVAAAPGLRPEDLNVTYNQGTVVLSGRIANAAEAEDAKGASWYLHELWHGRFERSITPPFEVDAGRAEATFEHGILLDGGSLTVGGAANTTITGAVATNGGLTKTGAGTLVLSAANSYTGNTTVSAGTLIAQSTYASSGFAVASGAVLGLLGWV